MRTSLTVLGVVVLAVVCAPLAAADTFTDRSAFEAANPGLPNEDFSGDFFANFNSQPFPGPLDSTTNNFLFAAGEILPGFQLDDDGGTGGGIVTVGIEGQRTVSVKNVTADTNIIFTTPVGAMGVNVWQQRNLGAPVEVELYGLGGVLILETTFVADYVGVLGLGSFIGFSGMGPITQMTMRTTGVTLGAIIIDNLTFGGAVVPEPGTFALLALGLVGAALARRRNGRRSAR